MAAQRTAWHFFFGIYLRKRGSPLLETREEVALSREPLRMDYLLLPRTTGEPIEKVPDLGLRGLWPRLTPSTVMEFKTVGRGYRKGDLEQLWAYAHLYQHGIEPGQSDRNDLGAVLVVPARTPSLNEDVDAMGLWWEDLGGGYWSLRGGLFRLLVVEVDRVCEAEADEHLRLFSSHQDQTAEGQRFWSYLVGTEGKWMALQDMDDYDEVLRRLLSGLTPKQLAHVVGPEQLAHALTPEQLVLALPEPMLRLLPEELLATLPEETRAEIRRRLGH